MKEIFNLVVLDQELRAREQRKSRFRSLLPLADVNKEFVVSMITAI